jgi:hypothetical protein
MGVIKVYHNPNFLDYWGNHSNIIPPTRPIAFVQLPEGTPVEQALEITFQKTQHLDDSWWNNDSVMLHVRSTSVGDVLADEEGNLFVVENMGFRPLRQAQCKLYQPGTIDSNRRLAEAYRLLDAALQQCDTGQITAVARQAWNAMQYALEVEGYPNGELPIFAWDEAQPGDLVGSPDTGLFRVIARKLRPKWRAKRLLAHVPKSQIWIDSPRTWAVLVPVKEEVQP